MNIMEWYWGTHDCLTKLIKSKKKSSSMSISCFELELVKFKDLPYAIYRGVHTLYIIILWHKNILDLY